MSAEFPDLNKKNELVLSEGIEVAEPKEVHPIEALKRELLQESPELAIDEDWFAEYIEIEKKLPGTLAALGGDTEQNQMARIAFDHQDVRNPLFSYENIDPKAYDAAETSLVALKNRVKEDMEAGNDERKEAGVFYIAKINEKIATYRMLKVIGEQKGQQEDPEITERRTRKIQRYADFLQPKPSREIFKFFLDAMRERVMNADTTNNPELEKAKQELLTALPEFLEEPVSLKIDPDKQQQVESLVQRELPEVFGISLDNIPKEKHAVQTVFDNFDSALKSLDPRWKAVWRAGNTAAAEPVTQEIRVGKSMNLEGNSLQKNFAHEMTHAERSIFAHRKLKLLTIGLDRYIDSEEGITTMKELAAYGESKDFGGYHSYIGTALGRGIEKKGSEGKKLSEKEWDVPPRDFRGTYDFYYKYFVFDKLYGKQNLSADEVRSYKKAASDDAWVRACRIFRGSNGQTVGYAYPKETSYGNGTFKAWGVIDASDNVPYTFKLMHKGKYDYANPRHVSGLKKLGILLEETRGVTEADLERLETKE